LHVVQMVTKTSKWVDKDNHVCCDVSGIVLVESARETEMYPSVPHSRTTSGHTISRLVVLLEPSDFGKAARL
jgi:hypothetical protein